MRTLAKRAEEVADQMSFSEAVPLDRDRVLAVLRSHREALRRRGVMRAAVFGSIARGDAHPDSDIDILVEIDPRSNLGMWEYAALTRQIRELFPMSVDVADRAELKPRIRATIERDAVYAF